MKFNGDRYSQPKRLIKGYSDCSSIIQKAGANMGLWKSTDTVTTKGIRDGDRRFYQISFRNLQRGDILWWQKPNINRYEGHVGIYLGGGKVLEAIYRGTGVYKKSRLGWQRVYRLKALETADSQIINDKVKREVITLEMIGKGIVNTAKLNVRDVDGTQGRILGQLSKGDKIDILGKTTNNWYQIKFNGTTAYVSGNYIDIVNEASDWAKNSVDKLVKLGITDGTRLKESITREETIVMIERALNL